MKTNAAPAIEAFDMSLLGKRTGLGKRSPTYREQVDAMAVGERMRFDYDESGRAWSYRTIAWRYLKPMGKRFTFRDTGDGLSLIRTA